MLRLDRMLEFERKYGDTYTCICGIDEAGRGPFAGPVVEGSVTFYVPYKRSDWQKGYQSMRFTLQGRKYRKKGDTYTSVLGAVTTQNISITERTLFNLE